MGAYRFGTMKHGYESPCPAVKAAALLESVERFHPLIDGNKPTAWTLMVLLLWINGYLHGFTTDEAFDLVVGVAAGTVDLLNSAAQIPGIW